MSDQGDDLMIDLSRYHKLEDRLTIFAVNGNEVERVGDSDDLQIADGEPVMVHSEEEIGRIFGNVKVISVGSADGKIHVVDGVAVVVITSERMILMVTGGRTAMAPVESGMVHTIALPWDLIDSVSMPARKSISDRVAGGRTIEIFSASGGFGLHLIPRFKESAASDKEKISDEDAMVLIVGALSKHRRRYLPPDKLDHLDRFDRGDFPTEDGELMAEVSLTDPNEDLPVHLVGRVVEHQANS